MQAKAFSSPAAPVRRLLLEVLFLIARLLIPPFVRCVLLLAGVVAVLGASPFLLAALACRWLTRHKQEALEALYSGLPFLLILLAAFQLK